MKLINLEDAIRRGEKLSVKEYSKEQRGEIINKLQTEFDIIKRQIHSGYLWAGMLWNFAMVNKMNHYWASHIRTANDLIKELNLPFSRSLLDNYGRIWKTFGGYLEKANINPPASRLIEAHSIVANIKDEGEKDLAIADWTTKAMTLPHEAWTNEVKEAKGLITTDKCPHTIQEPWARCVDCGKFFKVASQ